MRQRASFQTRARAIDHLGRGQIADAPTAVSELWKNAFDAYARDVELHIHAGNTVIASVIDNGHGMEAQDIIDKWLVVGTESKVKSDIMSESDTFGQTPRQRQGEKGIGRLSAAFLSPITLLVSKKVNSSFTAVLVDWRYFENPYLLISDIQFPLATFENIKDLPSIAEELFVELQLNMLFDEEDRNSLRVKAAWDIFSEQEALKGTKTTYDAIMETDYQNILKWDHVIPWKLIMDKYAEKDGGAHGTALFALKAYHELSCWVESGYEDEDTKDVQNNLRDTLVSFIDPFTDNNFSFNYSVKTHENRGLEKVVIDSVKSYDIEEFRALEHYLEGEFDSDGNFTGRVKAFGKDLGIKTIYNKNPNRYSGKDYLGAFKFCIGAVELEQRSTTLPQEEYIHILEQLDIYGGVCIFRDSLRVMPYGRVGADLFNIEERRSKNAGRYFWSYRKSFGRVSFTSEKNPNLKDKAGREGLVDNKARRELQRLVTNLLVESALMYFGRESGLRQNELPEIQKKNAAMKKAAEKAAKKNKSNFKTSLKHNYKEINDANALLKENSDRLSLALESNNIDILYSIRADIERLEAIKDSLILPNRPAKLGDLEETYFEYRSLYKEFSSLLESIKNEIRKLEQRGVFGDPRQVTKTRFHSNESKLSNQINKAHSELRDAIKNLDAMWQENVASDRKMYGMRCVNYLDLLEEGGNVIKVLDLLDKEYLELKEAFDIKYSGINNSLAQLLDDVDLEGAFMHAEFEAEKLSEKVDMLNSVAQLGISVEIIGHELEALESEVTKYLNRMPDNAKKLASFKLAYEAHKALVDRLRFLTPLKRSEYRNRIEISGKQIGDYLTDFFKDIFEKNRINFRVSESFKSIKIKDLPSRIYPTFINLVNNSLYWVQKGDSRYITLDFIDEKAIISDSGPGVQDDDLGMLFELFFTRRHNGRGIGLYLCRQNLAVAHHKIRYAELSDPKVHDGANFIIEFNGVNYEH